MRLFYKRTCISCTTYSTMLYLMLCKSTKEVENTAFHLDKMAVAPELYNALPNVQDFLYTSDTASVDEWKLQRKRIFKEVKNWRSVFSEFYILDHMPGIGLYTNFHRYNLLEDGPGVFQRMEEGIPYDVLKDLSENNLSWYKQAYTLYGPIWHRPLGRNPYCKKIFITEKEDADTSFLKNKRYELVNLRVMWNSKSEEYKEWLLGIFDITPEKLSKWQSFKTIILTQPWMDDYKLTEEEFVNCYINQIHKYSDDGVIIKPHPRDAFPWKEHFPEVEVMDTKMPMQFLCIMGICPKHAITMSSSSISVFDSQVTKIIMLGNSLCSKLLTKQQL